MDFRGYSDERTRPVGVANLATRCGAAAQKLTEVSSSLHGTSSRNCPVASPGGKLPDLTALRNRQGWLMRGGDRLVNGCSWMNGICPGFLHLTGKSETFSYRRPSSASLRSAAFPRGKPRGGSDGCFHTMHPVVPEAAGRQVGDPYSGRVEIGSVFHSSYFTTSVSPFGLTAPPVGAPRRLRRNGGWGKAAQ